MSERPRRPGATLARVEHVERITPHMVRIVLGGPEVAALAERDGPAVGTYTDHYVKLLFPADGVTYPEPFDLERIRAESPRDQWPRLRTYTVRHWNPRRGELTIDVVHHGDEGLAGPWAARVRPGDEVRFAGPGGGYAPDPDAGWHLMVGDESALPAIAVALERLPAGARAHVFIEVSGAAEEQLLESAADISVNWLHRGDARVGEALVSAVGGFTFPAGEVQVFVHGEAGFVKELRKLLFVERGVPRGRVSISGYWRLGHNEDRWQATKRDWNRQVEEEQDAA